MATSNEPPPLQWHRMFGLLLAGELEGSPFEVEVEMDLSAKQQLLDVIVVRRCPGALLRPLPDGLDDFVDHNLITFKSFRQTLDDWALKELTAHYVNYRKQVSGRGALIPEAGIRMYAVCARTPKGLFETVVPEAVSPGVYNCRRGTDTIRVIVARELPKADNNALLHLFSADADRVQYGKEHYDVPSDDISSAINDLFADYERGDLHMPYTMRDYLREKTLQGLDQLTPEERLRGLNASDVLKALPAAELAELARQVESRQKAGAAKGRKPKQPRKHHG